MTLRGRLAVALAAVAAAALPGAARAWKPYTHNYTGQQVMAAIDFARSTVSVDGVEWPLDTRVANAIHDCPGCFYAGTVGPDGFPDLTYGQAVVHPKETGQWLRLILDSAWAAQADGRYSAWEKQKILAFAYGFLVHASGDVWGHTLVNEFAHGVFPSVTLMPSCPDIVPIAVRHILAEGQVGDATPGFDGNPGYYGLGPDGHYTDRRTPGYAYDQPPNLWLYETLVAESAPTPIPATRADYMGARGPLVGGFLTLKANLNDFIAGWGWPDPLEIAMNAYDDTLAALEEVQSNCDFGANDSGFLDIAADIAHDTFWCPIKLAELGIAAAIDSLQAFKDLVVETGKSLAKAVLRSYIRAWIEDIDRALLHWGEFGLATTSGLFDAQTRRNVQLDQCNHLPEGTSQHRTCVTGVGILSVVMDRIDPFVYGYALSALGLPDIAADALQHLKDIVEAIVSELQDLLAAAGLYDTALYAALDTVRTVMRDLVRDAIAEVLGIDIEVLEDFLHRPYKFLCKSSVSMQLTRLVGTVNLELFAYGEASRLDRYMGFTLADHEPPEDPGDPAICGRLKDSAVYSPAAFAPVRDTVAMGKLLLLSGGTLDDLLGGMLGRSIGTYVPRNDDPHTPNIMVTALRTDPVAPPSPRTWLALIDGDHAWRRDGSPVFTSRAAASACDADQVVGGHGNFPLWGSCVLRRTHRALFRDWENPWTLLAGATASWQGYGPALGTAATFEPEHGDPVQSDPLNDPQAPVSTLAVSGRTYVGNGGQLYVGLTHAFTLTARDGPAGQAFADQDLQLRRCIAPGGGACNWTPSFQGDTFTLAAPDGLYGIGYQSADDCHGFDGRPGQPEAARTLAVCRDTTPPLTSCLQPPFGLSFTPDQQTRVAVSFDDGFCGSGLKAASATIDGRLGERGPVPISLDGLVDMYWYLPGTRTVAVTASDHLDNGATTPCTFELHGTTGSLMPSLQRACQEGSVDQHGICKSLMKKLEAAQAAHERGQHATEHNVLGAFTHELRAQGGKAVDPLRAEWLIAFAQDIIARGL